MRRPYKIMLNTFLPYSFRMVKMYQKAIILQRMVFQVQIYKYQTIIHAQDCPLTVNGVVIFFFFHPLSSSHYLVLWILACQQLQNSSTSFHALSQVKAPIIPQQQPPNQPLYLLSCPSLPHLAYCPNSSQSYD